MSFSDKVSRKRDKHGPIVAALRNAGWSVASLTHVITVVARATVPTRNANVLKETWDCKSGRTENYAAETSVHSSDTPEHDSVAI
jgi:hypothetical protein